MGNLTAFLAQNAKQVENVKLVVSDRFTDEDGKPLEWEVRCISSREDETLRRDCQYRVQVPGKRGSFRQEFDNVLYLAKLAAACTVYPNLNDNDDLVQDFEIETQPTRTYALRFDGYPCSGGKLDGLEAMKQAIFLILQTERFQYAIYSWNYGIELNALLGQTMTPYLQAKVAKAIEDALMADDRVLSVEQFSFVKGKRSLLVKFTVTTTEGDVESEFEFGGEAA